MGNRSVPEIKKIRYRVALINRDGRAYRWPVFTDSQATAATSSAFFVDWERPWVEIERQIHRAED